MEVAQVPVRVPILTPLEEAEHQLNTLLQDLNTAEVTLNKYAGPGDSLDAVQCLWRARKQLRDALVEVQRLPE